MDHQYFSIDHRAEVIECIEKSKFISQAFPVCSEEQANEIIRKIKKQHYKATHNVPAYIIGENQEIQKCSDDGEPSGTAGVPVLEIMKKESLTNILIVVTRYFGGIKLGAGGLIRAYAHMAKKVIHESQKIQRILTKKIEVVIDYTYWGKLENECNTQGFDIDTIDFLDKVYVYFYLQEHQEKDLYQLMKNLTRGEAEIKYLGKEYITIIV